jgi:hypothetical protein
MDEKQLSRLVDGSKRAQKTLARRQTARAEAQKYEDRRQRNLRLKEEFGAELMTLAEDNGLLERVEHAAAQVGGAVSANMRFHVHQGMSTCCIDPSLIEPEIGELRPSFLSLIISWEAGDDAKTVEIKMDRRQWLNFPGRFYSVPPLLWRRKMPKSLDALIEDAIRRAGSG